MESRRIYNEIDYIFLDTASCIALRQCDWRLTFMALFPQRRGIFKVAYNDWAKK